jgi:hypothetical protein
VVEVEAAQKVDLRMGLGEPGPFAHGHRRTVGRSGGAVLIAGWKFDPKRPCPLR